MPNARIFATILVALGVAVVTSCKQESNFAGSNGQVAKKPASKAAVGPDKGADPTKGDDDDSTDGNRNNPDDATPGTGPNGQQNNQNKQKNNPSIPNGGGSGSGLNSKPDLGNGGGVSPQPALPGTDQSQGGGLGSNIVDILQGILGRGQGIDSGGGQLGRQPDDNDIIFGDEKTFHIGDGQMTQSSCLETISPYPVAGRQYLFEFDVLADGQIAVEIGFVCGIDYSDTNRVYIAQQGQPVGQPQALPVGASTFLIPAMSLAKGRYQVAVESRTGTADPNGNPADADDYVLGKVHIQSKGAKIKIGKVYVN